MIKIDAIAFIKLIKNATVAPIYADAIISTIDIIARIHIVTNESSIINSSQ